MTHTPGNRKPRQAIANRARGATETPGDRRRAQRIRPAVLGEIAKHEPVQLAGAKPLAA